MTPYEKAQDLLKSLEVACPNLPTLAYAQIGGQVVSCESLIIAATGADGQPQDPLNLKCAFNQIGTFVITVARDCAFEATEDGVDDPVEVARVSAQMDQDGDCLWGWAQNLDPYISKDFSLGFTLQGGLAITSMQLTLGID
jgi:hypothetical protein